MIATTKQQLMDGGGGGAPKQIIPLYNIGGARLANFVLWAPSTFRVGFAPTPFSSGWGGTDYRVGGPLFSIIGTDSAAPRPSYY